LDHRELLYEFERSLDAIEEVVWNYTTGISCSNVI